MDLYKKLKHDGNLRAITQYFVFAKGGLYCSTKHNMHKFMELVDSINNFIIP